MKRSYYILILICFLTISCSKEELIMITRYQGIVLEQSEKQPIEGLLTMLTDGATVFDSTRTDIEGKFFLTADWAIMDENYYLYLDGEGKYPSKEISLTGTRQANFDFFYLYLYDKETLNAPPIVKDGVTVKYVDNQLVFSDIIISSEYSLVETSIVVTDSEGQKYSYPLENTNGNYSGTINNLTIGEWYRWAIYAENGVDCYTTEPHALLFGYPNIIILPITQATTSSITVSCSITGDTPYPTEDVGFCWGDTNTPNMNNHKNAIVSNSMFSEIITNLDFTTTHYVWAYIRNKNGMAYSEPVELKACNPLNLFEFKYNNYIYTVYDFKKKMSWYQAVTACLNLDVCFDDWNLPRNEELAAYVSVYINEYNVLPYTTIWSYLWDYDMDYDSGTSLFTPNGFIWEDKQNKHNVVAVRKYKL